MCMQLCAVHCSCDTVLHTAHTILCCTLHGVGYLVSVGFLLCAEWWTHDWVLIFLVQNVGKDDQWDLHTQEALAAQ